MHADHTKATLKPQGEAILTGNVKVKDGAAMITADKMIAYYRNSTCYKVVTTGNVTIIKQDKTARGDIAIFYPLLNEAELKGKPVKLTSKGIKAEGEIITYDANKKEICIEKMNAVITKKDMKKTK